MILPEEPDAARRAALVWFDASNEVGTSHFWIDRKGHVFPDEQMARWSSATHVHCSGCGAPTRKPYTACELCRAESRREKYERLERRPWDGVSPVTMFDGDEWFEDLDQAEEYAADNLGLHCAAADLMLVHCKPRSAWELNPADIYEEILPECSDVPTWLQDAFDQLNAIIRAHAADPLCWIGSDIAVELQEIGEIQGPDHA